MGYHSRLRYLVSNQADAAKYEAWTKMDAAQKQALYKTAAERGGPRVPVNRQSGWLIPMKATATAKVIGKYPVFGTNPGHAVATACKGILQPKFQKLTPPTGFETSEPLGAKKPAILRLTEREANAIDRTSRILNKVYKAKKTDSASGGFGKETEAKTSDDTIADVEAAAIIWANSENRKYKVINEIHFIL